MSEIVDQPRGGASSNPLAYVWLTLLLVLASGLRLAAVGESLWLDELHTAWTVSGNASELIWRSSQGNQSSLYFWLVRGSVGLFGMNEFAVRLPSLLAGVGLVGAVYALVKKWTASSSAGLLAAALVAIDPVFIFYSVEARTYALVQLLTLGQVYLFWRTLGDHAWKLRLLLAAASTTLVYLHYTSGLLLAAETVWLLLAVVRGRLAKAHLLRWSLDLLLVAFFCLPTLPHLKEIAERREQWKLFVAQPSIRDISTILRARTYLLPCMAVLAFAAVMHRRRGEQSWPSTRSIPLGLVLCWMLVPVLLAWLSTRADIIRVFHIRYLSIALVTPLILASFAWVICPGRRFRSSMALALVAFAIAQSGLVELSPFRLHAVSPRHRRNEDWRAAVAWLRQKPPQPLLLRSGLIEVQRWNADADDRQREYATLPVRSIYRLDDRLPIIIPYVANAKLQLSPERRRQIARAKSVYLLTKDAPANAERIAERVSRQNRSLDRGKEELRERECICAASSPAESRRRQGDRRTLELAAASLF